jgi:hypothetical protein
MLDEALEMTFPASDPFTVYIAEMARSIATKKLRRSGWRRNKRARPTAPIRALAATEKTCAAVSWSRGRIGRVADDLPRGRNSVVPAGRLIDCYPA